MKNNYKILILILSVLVFLMIYHFVFLKREGFDADPTTVHNDYMLAQLKKTNPVGLALIANHNQGALGSNANDIFTTTGSPTNLPLDDKPSGLFAIIDKCEKKKVADCSVFDDPDFVPNCGLCLDIGTNSKNEPATGGLALLEEDRKYAQSNHKGNGPVKYIPTVGTCPAGKMVATKDECLRLQTQIKCEKNANYDIKNCSQCYSDTSYTMVDTNPSAGITAGSGTIYLIGNCIINFSETGYSSKSNVQLSRANPTAFNLEGPEGTRITISAGSSPNGQKPSLGGYLSGKTQAGKFTMDLIQLVLTDSITGRKPRESDRTTVKGNDVSIMAPGFGQKTMALVVVIPFTFVDPNSYEASKCADSPFVTTQAGAQFLQSDPCYKKGSGPGKYSMECLQGVFLSNGCVQDGTGYPSNTQTMSQLMAKEDGTYRSMNEISDMIYESAVSASTGISSNGVKLSIKEWSNKSEFCTGNSITSPCDTAEKNTGPLSVECLSYLWNNEGSKPLDSGKANPMGSTYSVASLAKSLFTSSTKVARFCHSTGTLSPLTPTGEVNASAMAFWKSQGGVANVKSVMKNIHEMANKAGLSDTDRLPYIEKCYGPLQLAQRPVAPTPAPPPPVPTPAQPVFKCSGASLPTTVTPIQGNIIGRITVTSDYTLSFDITPKGTVGNWGSILHFTVGSDCCGPNHRDPAIWFMPGNLGLYVRFTNGTTGDFGFANVAGCTLGKKTNVQLSCSGTTVKLTVGSTVQTMQSGPRYAGPAVVYSADPWYTPANCLIENLCYIPVTPVYTCLNLPRTVTPRQGTSIGNINATSDYVLSFNITPRGIVKKWGSILHFTKGGIGGDCCANGSRVPVIFFTPGDLKLAVRIGDLGIEGGNWGLDHQPGCAINKKTYVKLECIGKNITLSIDSNVVKATQPTTRYSGPVTVYSGFPNNDYDPANCLIEDLCYNSR